MIHKVFIHETIYVQVVKMAEKIRKGKYTGLSLPLTLMNEIEKITKDDLNYKGLTDFTKDAIREKLDNMIIENELSNFEKIIFRDLMRQKRLEALKESMNFRKAEIRVKSEIKSLEEKIKTGKSGRFNTDDYDLKSEKDKLKRIEKKKNEIKKNNDLNGHGVGVRYE